MQARGFLFLFVLLVLVVLLPGCVAEIDSPSFFSLPDNRAINGFTFIGDFLVVAHMQMHDSVQHNITFYVYAEQNASGVFLLVCSLDVQYTREYQDQTFGPYLYPLPTSGDIAVYVGDPCGGPASFFDIWKLHLTPWGNLTFEASLRPLPVFCVYGAPIPSSNASTVYFVGAEAGNGIVIFSLDTSSWSLTIAAPLNHVAASKHKNRYTEENNFGSQSFLL